MYKEMGEKRGGVTERTGGGVSSKGGAAEEERLEETQRRKGEGIEIRRCRGGEGWK